VHPSPSPARADFSTMMRCTPEIGNRHSVCTLWLSLCLYLCDLCWNFETIYGGYRNRVGIGLPYRPARLHRVGVIDSLESILGLLESLKIRALCTELAVFSVWALIHAVAGQKVGYGLCIPHACTNQDVRWDSSIQEGRAASKSHH
jgi:hypothetical protein